ncbi:insulinase family protein [Candidatus Woesearchaeota archaeon]|nr:insulinase family protein [Candidatus Woesearchaeota archaeon]
MIRTKNSNIRTIYKRRDSDLVSINVSVLVGSANETAKIRGIAHFMEHMVFEGTKNRNAEEITSAIEQYGGEFNAYTTIERTNYFIKIHRKHAKKAFEVLADMMINPSFDEKAIKKEKGVVLGEIKMVNDQPRHFQWIMLERNLQNGKFKWATYGTEDTVKSLRKKDLLQFHKDYYTKDNMIITIVGDCPDYKRYICQYFGPAKSKKARSTDLKNNVINSRKSESKRKRVGLKYLIIGYQTPRRNNFESYILDVIHAILARGQSGRLFIEIRTKRGLGYDLGIFHNVSRNFGYFAFYASAEKKNIKEIEEIFFKEVEKLKDDDVLQSSLIREAKSYIEGQVAVKVEDSQEHADLLSFFEESGQNFEDYIKNIRKVTRNDILRIARKYLNKKYTKITIE